MKIIKTAYPAVDVGHKPELDRLQRAYSRPEDPAQLTHASWVRAIDDFDRFQMRLMIFRWD